MDWCEKCAIIIPCLNEAATIAPLVEEARGFVHTVFVVDDGSRDDTRQIAFQAGARVLAHARNLGKGAALKTGFQAAADNGFEWAITMDGDHQHSPNDIPRFFACAQKTQAAMVIGNRMRDRSIPWVRRKVNRWMSRQLSFMAGRLLPDSQCGFRLVQLKAWARLPLRSNRFEIESEMLLAFLTAGYSVEFIPIEALRHRRPSHIDPVPDTVRWLLWWRQARRKLQGQPAA